MCAAKSLAKVRKGEALHVPLWQQQVHVQPMKALPQRWSDSQTPSLLCLGMQSPAKPADVSCPLSDSSVGLLVLLLTSYSSPRSPCRCPVAPQLPSKHSYTAVVSCTMLRSWVVLQASLMPLVLCGCSS